MERSTVAAVMLTLLLTGMLTLPFNIQLAESSKSSVTEWNRTYGGVWFDVAHSIVEASDGGYALVGYTESFPGNEDFWLIKTDAEGNMQLNRTYGGEIGDRAFSLVQTSDGGYALAGITFSFGAGGDFWLVKTDSAGNMEWNRTYGGANAEIAASVVETHDGGYALVGTQESHDSCDSWLVKTDAAGNMEWNKTYGGANWDQAYCVVETSDGGYALAGLTESFGAGGEDFWLVKVAEPTAEDGFGPLVLYVGLASSVVIVAVAIAVYITRKRARAQTKNN